MENNFKEFKEKFTDYLQIRGLNHKTIHQYLAYLNAFGYPLPFTQDRINQFVIEKNNGTPARAFVNNLKDYILSSEELQGIDMNIINRVKLHRITGAKKKKVIDVITEEQVRRIAPYLENERNKLMLYFQFYGGLRTSELVGDGHNIPGIRIYDFDFNWNQLHNKINGKEYIGSQKLKIIGKRDKERWVFLPEWLIKRTHNWLSKHPPDQDYKENFRVFRVCGRRWETILKKAGERALKRDLYPHLLRHSLGSHLFNKGWDLKKIADYLGHDDVNTTTRYVHTEKDYLKTDYDKVFKD